jgi:hypothetical protein
VEKPGFFWQNMGIGWIAACISSLVGLQLGDWLKNLKR